MVLPLPLRVGCPQASVPAQTGQGLSRSQLGGTGSLRLEGGRKGTVVIIGMLGKPVAAEASVVLQQPEAHCVFSWGSCLSITGPWQWRVAQAPSGVWIVTCACIQDSW